MTDRASRRKCAKMCSSHSCVSMTPATRMKAGRGWDWRSLATLPARTAATSRSPIAHWADCGRRCGCRSSLCLCPARSALCGVARAFIVILFLALPPQAAVGPFYSAFRPLFDHWSPLCHLRLEELCTFPWRGADRHIGHCRKLRLHVGLREARDDDVVKPRNNVLGRAGGCYEGGPCPALDLRKSRFSHSLDFG